MDTAIKHPVPDLRNFSHLGTLTLRAEHRMLFSCAHMTTKGVNGKYNITRQTVESTNTTQHNPTNSSL